MLVQFNNEDYEFTTEENRLIMHKDGNHLLTQDIPGLANINSVSKLKLVAQATLDAYYYKQDCEVSFEEVMKNFDKDWIIIK